MGAHGKATRRLGTWLLLLTLAAGADAAPDEFKKAKKRYEKYLERPSLYMRNRGREKFAKTADVRALKILAKSYARPEVPKDQVRYLLASMCADNFQGPPHLQVFRDWRRKRGKNRDAWLWYRALRVEHKLDGPEALVEIIRGRKDPILRAAALEALTRTDDAVGLPLLTELLLARPTRPFERDLLLGSAAATLHRKRAKRRTEPWQALAKALLPCLDDAALPEHTRLRIARRLAPTFRTKILYRTSAPWLALLGGEEPTADAAPADTTRARFLGLQASGTRIGYVIDISDSMLTPLTGKEIRDLRNPPKKTPVKPKPVVTGKQPAGTARKKKPPAKQDPDEADRAALPWEKIRTRFDAAREFLKISLRTLSPEQSFFVVTFGSKAELMDATPGLRRADEANIERVIQELDAIEVGPPKKNRPHGTLGGYTNLHGGLHRAFEVKARSLVKEREYVDPEIFERGCDTIFLLSDGAPTWDDYPQVDLLEAEDDSGDPESRGKIEQAKKGTFYGPYALSNWLLDDLMRMNLFRRVEIHCVGLGEYDATLLAAIARAGLGQFRRIGAK